MSRSGPLSDAQLHTYREQGFLFQQSLLPTEDVDLLCREAEAELSEDSPRRSLEPDGGPPYRVHGSHLSNELMRRLVRLPELLDAARQLLDDDVYVHQFKVNKKRAFRGEPWKWHQDFTFWHLEDAMPRPRAVTATIFLTDVDEFNGPIIVVPAAHEIGQIVTEAKTEGWSSTLTNQLKYSLEDSEQFAALVKERGLCAPKGSRGSVLWFHANIPHGSAENMSATDRTLLLVTYNSVENALPAPSPRPEWLVSRDFTPLTTLRGERLRTTSVPDA